MPKSLNLMSLLILSLLVMFTISCEGPAGSDGTDGLAGADGLDGADGNVTCMVCHSEANIIDNQIELARSQHGVGEFINYADYYGGGCARCHSGNGFVEFVETGEVADNVKVPEAWSCGTCHGLHQTFDSTDYALRVTAGVEAMFDATVTLDVDENSNLCITCHQARKGPSLYWDGSADSVSVGGHDGPHHSVQGNVLLGNLGATSTGVAGTHETLGCVGCHMIEATGDDANKVGGHTFKPALESCTPCHTGATNFDWHGKQTELEADLATLSDKLITAGIIDSTGHLHSGKYTDEVFQAWWNYTVLIEDRSLGVHNPSYAVTLVDEAIALLP